MGRKLNGFTLAEVLITLVIIGVIAAMTIPSLMNNTNEQETVVAVKKAYSVLAQAYQRVRAENGEIIPSTLGSSTDEATKTLGEMFAKQLNTQKICGMSTDEDCFSTQNGGMYKYFDGRDWYNFNYSADDYRMALSDGMSVGVHGYPEYIMAGNNESLQNVIGHINVDINGYKSPNAAGKDLFTFYITKYGILPLGTPDDTSNPLSICRTGANSGYGCTAWVTTKGNMDYLHKDVSW